MQGMTVVVRALLALLAGLSLAVGGTACTVFSASTSSVANSSVTDSWGTVSEATPSEDAAPAGIPPYVLETLALIDAGDWPDAANAPGTKGGERFGNREQRLPKNSESGQRINYQEWDVNPKERDRGRDAERIVTGNDGSAWYTADHYDSFDRIR